MGWKKKAGKSLTKYCHRQNRPENLTQFKILNYSFGYWETKTTFKCLEKTPFLVSQLSLTTDTSSLAHLLIWKKGFETVSDSQVLYVSIAPLSLWQINLSEIRKYQHCFSERKLISFPSYISSVFHRWHSKDLFRWWHINPNMWVGGRGRGFQKISQNEAIDLNFRVGQIPVKRKMTAKWDEYKPHPHNKSTNP